MIHYEFSSIIDPDILITKICELFELQDTPVCQEIIDYHLGKLNGDISNMNQEYQELAYQVAEFFDHTGVIGFEIFLRAGERLQFDDYVLYFPKIIAKYKTRLYKLNILEKEKWRQ